jgi:hypothetical protein
LLGSIPAIYKEDAKPKAPIQRTDKLQGDAPAAKGAGVDSSKATDANAILDVHGAPTDMQQSGDK